MKKGPGRRPQSAKRQRFMELARARGWTIRGAGREVGVSRTTASNWARGYKVYRRGQAGRLRRSRSTGWPCGRSARGSCRRTSGSSSRTCASGPEHPAIACRLGRAPSTISRELRRNATTAAVTARSTPTARRPHDGPAALAAARRPTCARTAGGELLSQRWSPQQIGRHLRQVPERPGMWLCHESIYQAVYQPGSTLLRPPPLAPHRRPRCGPGETTAARSSVSTGAGRGSSSRCSPSIDRPFPPEDRSEPGHWEGDLIVGRDQGSAIGTLVERRTRPSGYCTCPTGTPTPCTPR